ncbi:(2Fe-2S)-binding protein [Staphylothermus hellenicus]|uniref:BFD domain protein (2Fe-2S)-binding domain protein n=1 Tax=Staphylothermus hellenicus (strain DSM 12710 / JCM 10830 / BK20S6-10-b1 / P8) TaxID=591019 RepID=D7D809_STAHD|nr:(2Fe-2S)-binding protein [Staphylothermus hellenicus]ADI31905.1 BFD domain protein (2Fe-2S)-binding domain protein [Staphylothermus hellenicus DSM 12710]
MDPRKVIVCRCENVTLADVEEAIDKGYTDLESLKRYLRIGMGPCQGRHCLILTAEILARKTGKKFEEVFMPKNRPPLAPIEFKFFLKTPIKR